MAQNTCFQNTFLAGGAPVYTSINFMPLSKITGSWVFSPDKPFVPYSGSNITTISGTDTHTPDIIANNVAFVSTFLQFFIETLQASVNNALSLVGSEIVSDSYQQYLFKTVYQKVPVFNRFISLATIVTEFWNNVNLAWTNEQYYNALTSLIDKISIQGDKTLYIPPATYTIANASQLSTDLDLWAAGNPNFDGMLITEFYQ